MEEHEATSGHSVRWIVYNMPAGATTLPEAIPERGNLTAGALQGVNDLGKIGYSAACPPSGTTHHYIFNLYALDIKLRPESRATAEYIERAMKGHILARAEITGVYAREAGSTQ